MSVVLREKEGVDVESQVLEVIPAVAACVVEADAVEEAEEAEFQVEIEVEMVPVAVLKVEVEIAFAFVEGAKFAFAPEHPLYSYPLILKRLAEAGAELEFVAQTWQRVIWEDQVAS